MFADEGKLEQILLNLAINARDAMKNGCQLTIATNLRFRTETTDDAHLGLEAGDYVALRVSDSGCGMSEETRNRIFEPFFTTKAVEEGTGLGLSTVFGIVQEASGQIEVTSKVGEGTTFEILLPRAAPPDDNPSSTPREEIVTGYTETVLLVEDEEAVRMTVSDYLTQAGFKVLEAKDGLEALEILRGHAAAIDTLVTDMVMPGANGAEVSRDSRKIRPEILTVFMSAHDEAWLVKQGRLESGETALQKPFDQVDLITTIRESLKKRTPSRSNKEGLPSAKPEVISRTVLVVEDQRAARMAICETLKDEGYRVLEAKDGEAAVQLGRNNPGTIDVLLTDAVLPKLAGPEVAA